MNYSISATLSYSAGTGTISCTGGTINFTGSGTAFQTELSAGKVIQAGGQTLCVVSISDDTHGVFQTAPITSLSSESFTYAALTNIETLVANSQPPKAPYREGEDSINLHNGLARWLGRPSCVWTWGFISLAERNALRNICSDKSARVYIRTRINDSSDAYRVFTAAMIWPDEEDRSAGRRLNFSIQFRDLVML